MQMCVGFFAYLRPLLQNNQKINGVSHPQCQEITSLCCEVSPGLLAVSEGVGVNSPGR